jgi:hypothetical protein
MLVLLAAVTCNMQRLLDAYLRGQMSVLAGGLLWHTYHVAAGYVQGL